MAMKLKRVLSGLALAAALGTAGCASVPPPTGEMATARAALDNARRADAGQLAPVEMGEAQDLLTRAERAEAGKDFRVARRAAEQARATAELAEEKARLAKTMQVKSELDNTLNALRGGSTPTPQTR